MKMKKSWKRPNRKRQLHILITDQNLIKMHLKMRAKICSEEILLSIKELGRVKVHPIVAVCSLAWFSAIIPIATCPMDQKTACQLVLHCTRENNTSSSLTLVRIVRKNLTRSYPPCRVNRVSKESESASRCS